MSLGQRDGPNLEDSVGALPEVAWGALVPIAAAGIAILLLVGGRNGYHRDELYFLEASRHLAWGYVDQPPLSIVFVWLSRALFGDTSLVGLRVFPALAFGSGVLLTGLVARELGGRRFPQTLSALALATSPFLIAGHLAGPTVFDLVAWTLVSLLVIRIVRTGREHLWLLCGLVVGVGLLNKETILFLVAGLVVGFVVNRQTSILRSPWTWAGAGIALAIWSPTLVWQSRHGWAMLEMSRNIRREHSGLAYGPSFVAIQLLLPGWWTAPIWMAGWWAFWRERRFRPYRAFAVAYGLLFVLIGVFIGDRPYYLGPLYAVLLAGGAIVTEGVVDGVRRFFSDRRPSRRFAWRSRRAAVGIVLVFGVLGLPLALPVLPASALAAVPLQKINYNLGEEIGWPELVATVAQVYDTLPPADRASAAIVAANYGEAGAVDRYGAEFGLPRAYSGHNNYWWWGPPPPATGTTIAVGFEDPSELTPFFGRVERAATIENAAGVDNDEEGAPVWLCRDQASPWPAIWPEFRHYG